MKTLIIVILAVFLNTALFAQSSLPVGTNMIKFTAGGKKPVVIVIDDKLKIVELWSSRIVKIKTQIKLGGLTVTAHDKRVNPCGFWQKPVTIEVVTNTKPFVVEATPQVVSSHIRNSPTGWRMMDLATKKISVLMDGHIKVNVQKTQTVVTVYGYDRKVYKTVLVGKKRLLFWGNLKPRDIIY